MTGPGSRVYSDAYYLIEQCTDCPVPGYLIVTPLSGAGRLEDLTHDELIRLGNVLALAVRAVKEATRPVRVYCALFGEKGGPLHFHIFPRSEEITREYLWENPSEEGSIDGPNLLGWSRRRYAHGPDQGRITEVTDRIREAIETSGLGEGGVVSLGTWNDR
jgi:diadenosine tetraphosphate (Ap4A) HIT family hydrolase